MPGAATVTLIQGCDYLSEPPAYDHFLRENLLQNRPLIIGPSLISDWPAYVNWATLPGNCDESKDQRDSLASAAKFQSRAIDWDYLASSYGHLEVTVADCSTREFSDQKRETKHFGDVIELWKLGRGTLLYVKDWHLIRALRAGALPGAGSGHSAFYVTPSIFRDDWMNAYYSAHTADDFRFVYVGAAATFTPLHRDVYTSYSWSANVCGRKRWWLFPPEQTHLLLRKGGEEHLEVAFDVRDVDPKEYPRFSEARPIVVDQNDGETIFVPSGWYHQVVNLTDCISINHNWCNSLNLPSLYASMCAKVAEVERVLDDVRDMLAQNGDDWQAEWVHIVQNVVEKDAGWNWLTFWRMVLHALEVACQYATHQALAQDSPKVAPSLWEDAPPEFTPPLMFIYERVRGCCDDFRQREAQEVTLVPGLHGVLASIERLLH